MLRAQSGVLCLASSLLLLGIGLGVPAGVLEAPSPERRFKLLEKGSRQSLYRHDGRLDRAVEDRNGDGRVDTILMYEATRRLRRAELDEDGDGTIDRWHHYATDGRLERVGSARRAAGVPDQWVYPDGAGRVARRDLDQDGDGRIDRIERFVDGEPYLQELDDDRDGVLDRRITLTSPTSR